MNPWNESLRIGFANPPAWIRKDSFRAIVLRIRQDSWGFVGFVKTGRIFGSSGHETNPRFESLRIGLTNPDLRICEVRIRDTIQNKSFWSQDSWLRYEMNPWIRETNPRFYESLIRIPHPYQEYLGQRNSCNFGSMYNIRKSFFMTSRMQTWQNGFVMTAQRICIKKYCFH